ncbi:MAG: GNAT family N-acetyltransferase [Planctomycetota bacterium]
MPEPLPSLQPLPSDLTVDAVSDRAGRERVYDLRAEVYREDSDYLLHAGNGQHPAQDRFDRDAFLFAAFTGGAPVATCRFTPPRAGRWEASEAGPVPAAVLGADRSDPAQLLQISRVVVHPDVRRLGVSEAILRDACRWLLAHTDFRSYFALCLPALAHFYEHFGAATVPGAEVRLAERGNKLYRFVHGTLAGSERVIDDYLASRLASVPGALPVETIPGASDVA